MRKRQNFYAFGHLPYAWITQHPPTSAIVVWALLQDHRNAQGVCWPSLQRLEQLSGLSRSSLQRGIRWLRDKQYIDVEQGGGESTSRYIITWDANKIPQEYAELIPKKIMKKLKLLQYIASARRMRS